MNMRNLIERPTWEEFNKYRLLCVYLGGFSIFAVVVIVALAAALLGALS